MAANAAEQWDGIYSTTASDRLSWYQPHAAVSMELIAASGLAKASRVADVGAGTSRLADDLVASGYTSVVLVDVSSAALELTRQRLSGQPAVEYLIGDVAHVDIGMVDLWHDRALFHFLLGGNDRARYVDSMFRHIRPGGYAVIAAFAEDGPESCSGFPTMRYSAEELAASFVPEFVLRATRREIHTKPAGGQQSFNYVLLERRAGK
jgi:ubiquinone/menaquinone biosynthesis C-methylase UbiE